jgi:phage baseplate assembly protein gpV
MLKFGKITNIDYENCKAKVQFDDNKIVSKYLPISVNYSFGDSHTFSFEINTPVFCIMDDNLENGVIGGAIYNKNTLPKGAAKNKFSHEFSDGTRIEYNKESHELNITGSGLKVIFHGGVNSGMVKAPVLKTESEKDKAIIDTILTVLNGASIPEPGSGSPSALQIALKSALTGKSSGVWTGLENDKIKH